MMLLLPLLFQAVSGDPQVTAPAPTPAKPVDTMVCKMEPVTGSRTEKIKVCKSKAVDKAMEGDRDRYKEFLMNNGNGQQPPKP